MGNFIIQDQWENQEQDTRVFLGVTHHRRQRRMERSSEHGQGPEGVLCFELQVSFIFVFLVTVSFTIICTSMFLQFLYM